MAQHEAQRQEDQLALQEKEKRITELEEALHSREKLEEQRKVGVARGMARVYRNFRVRFSQHGESCLNHDAM